MATVDSDGLTQLLSSIHLDVGTTRRAWLAPATFRPFPPAAVTLVYLAEGSARVHPAVVLAGRLDAGSSPRIDAEGGSDRSALLAGDAILTLGARPFTLESEQGASIVIVEIQLADAAGIRAVLPDVVAIPGFARLEPAAAALATSMGITDPGACGDRASDPVICRLMAATVLLSAIRAWAEPPTAPTAGVSTPIDPFLERVVRAIHDQPGRDWTVELLASVGAMSRSAFAERFRSALGRSPASYVAAVRMSTAKGLLEQGMAVSAVARELGYGSDEGFSRAFRRHTGVTPSRWRRRPAPVLSVPASEAEGQRARLDAPKTAAPSRRVVPAIG
ncbi:helix-turn-helix transcriptional regulator [Microbacterium lushaniae]|nr:helix-turn-helix transcriptional regulator [Microbacterium lushaniae]KAA9159140.1 helix-turn-helix transcriptional regulator [Microbacterium lushaniae]